MAVPLSSLSPCAAWGSPTEKKAPGDRDRIIHPRALADPPVVDVAAGVGGRHRADIIGFRRRESHRAEVESRRHAHVGQDVLASGDELRVDPDARVVDRRVNDSIRICLRRPDIVVDSLGERLARRIELVDRDDLARLRLLNQVLVVEPPVCRRVRAEAAARVARAAAWARADVEDAHFEDVAGLCVFDRDRAGEQVHADSLAGAPLESDDWAGAAPVHGFFLARPVEDRLGAGIVLDHPLVIVVGVMGQRFDGGAVARFEGRRRFDRLAEIPPMHGRWRNGQGVVRHDCLRLSLKAVGCAIGGRSSLPRP